MGRIFNKRQLPALMAAVLAVVILAGSCGPRQPTPEEQVRALIAQGEQAAADKDRPALIALVADSFNDHRGRDRQALDDMLRAIFRQTGKLFVLTRIETIDVIGPDAAEAVVLAAVATLPITSIDELAELDAELLRIDLTLAATDGDWLVTGATWRPAALTDFGQP